MQITPWKTHLWQYAKNELLYPIKPHNIKVKNNDINTAETIHMQEQWRLKFSMQQSLGWYGHHPWPTSLSHTDILKILNILPGKKYCHACPLKFLATTQLQNTHREEMNTQSHTST